MTLNPPSSSNTLTSGFRKWNQCRLWTAGCADLLPLCARRASLYCQPGSTEGCGWELYTAHIPEKPTPAKVESANRTAQEKLHTCCRIRVLEWSTGARGENWGMEPWIIQLLISYEHCNLRIWAGCAIKILAKMANVAVLIFCHQGLFCTDPFWSWGSILHDYMKNVVCWGSDLSVV